MNLVATVQDRAYHEHIEYPPDEMQRRAGQFYSELDRRRSVRHFAPRPLPAEVLENCLRAAGTAPSGANHQPWHFVVVTEPGLRKRLREAAEKEEREFYGGRAPQEWLDALEPLGTNADKPFLEEASCLVAIFAESVQADRQKNYYVQESVGIATGMLITALHHAGLCCLTHTPSPMNFLREMLGRPSNERPFLLLVVGYPVEGCRVPDIARKSLDEIATFL